MRFRMQKEAVPDGNCRRDWPEPRFAGDQTARTTRSLLFSPVIPSFFPLYLSLFLYTRIFLPIAWLITNRCLDLDRRLPKLPSPFDESPSLSPSFSRKYLKFSILDRNHDTLINCRLLSMFEVSFSSSFILFRALDMVELWWKFLPTLTRTKLSTHVSNLSTKICLRL